MTVKIRLIILASCAVLFLLFAPYIVLYSIGYRVDFANMKIRGTGGIYVYAVPDPSSILIDSKPAEKASLFSNAFFMQNMMPGLHTVLIKKGGYYDYQKSLQVQKKEVTKLESVVLFKNNILFNEVSRNNNYFYLSPDGKKLLTANISDKKLQFEVTDISSQEKKTFALHVPGDLISKPKITDLTWTDDSTKFILKIQNYSNYYFLGDLSQETAKITPLTSLTGTEQASFNPQDSTEIFYIKNKNLYSNKKNIGVLENIITYQVKNQMITWLSYDGFTYNSSIDGTNTSKITLKPLSIKTTDTFGTYKISTFLEGIFLEKDESLFLLNKSSGTFENIHSPVKNIVLSPDGKKMLYFNDLQLWYYIINPNITDNTSLQKTGSILLNKSSLKIKGAYWLNNDYIVFSFEKGIIISEIDPRNNINTITLPEIVLLNELTSIQTPTKPINFTIKNPQIIFNQQDKKLYILSEGNLIVSEKMIP